MDKLLLFTGFPKNTEQAQLYEFLEKHFKRKQIQNLWMDPRQEARAVALFENDLDFERIKSKLERRCYSLEGYQIFLEKANPTNCVLVHTYNALAPGPVDKLKMLFGSKKNYCGQIEDIVEITDGVFEIIFENGWDSVFSASQKKCKVGNITFDICPFFDCFTEPADEQIKRLSKNLQSVPQKKINPEPTLHSPAIKEKIYSKEFVLKNKILAFLLFNLNFESAIKDLKITTVVVERSKSWEITFKGLREKIKQIYKLLAALEKILEISKEEKRFLKDEDVKKNLKLLFQKEQFHLVFSFEEKADVFVENKNKSKIKFDEFLFKILWKIDCSPFLEGTSNSHLEWTSHLESFIKAESPNYPIYVIMEDSKVKLLTVWGNENMVNPVVEKLKQSINGKKFEFQNDGSDADKDSSDNVVITETFQISSNAKINETFTTMLLSVSELKYKYCSLFLMDELNEVVTNCKCSSVRLVQGNIQIHGPSKNVESAASEIKYLIESIIVLEKNVSYPGFSKFIESSDGLSVINTVSEKFQCLIEFQNINSKNSPRLEAVQKETVRIDYRVLMLQTARFGGFNIHLVQGKMGDMKLNMTVDFNPKKQDNTSRVTIRGKSLQLEILLPEWKSCHGKTNKEHFANLRFSLREAVKLVLDQAKETNCHKIGFSTEKIHYADFSFPLDCIAEVLVSELVNTFELARISEGEQSVKNRISLVDVYVIESGCNAVFKALDYFITKYNGKVEGPDQASWDNVCPQDFSEYTDYSEHKTRVEVRDNNFGYTDEKTLFCYPVDLSLEVETCPAYEEHHSIGKILSESLNKITDELPDGLQIGEVLKVKSFPDKKDVVIFGTSSWGADSDKMIQTLLENCIIASSEFDAVHIVLPGVQGTSKFPKEYYAQTVFKVLDSLLPKNKLCRQKRIVLIIKCFEYKTLFERELMKHYPVKEKVGHGFSIGGFINSYIWSIFDKGNENKAPVWKTKLNDTSLHFWSLSFDKNHEAAAELEKVINRMLNTNTETLKLTLQQTTDFEKFMKNPQEIFVTVILEKHCEGVKYKQGSEQNFHMSDKKFQSSTLTIQGLSEDVVKEFKTKIKSIVKIDKSNQCSEGAVGTARMKVNYPESSTRSYSSSTVCSNISTKDFSHQQNASTTYFPEETPLNLKSFFLWKYENVMNEACCFENVKPELNGLLEKAYLHEKSEIFKFDSSPIMEINFTNMKITTIHKKKHIIRCEVFQNLGKTFELPSSWLPMENKILKLIVIHSDRDNLEFKNLERKINNVYFRSHKISIKKIERIQNVELFTTFELKKLQMKSKLTRDVWHRVSKNTRCFVLRYGFHKAFSAMPDGSNLGDGVLFSDDVKGCLEDKDLIDGESDEIYLIYSTVLLGRNDYYGNRGVRSAPFTNSYGRECDSVLYQSKCMLFSNSQAYPCHLVTITCIRK